MALSQNEKLMIIVVLVLILAFAVYSKCKQNKKQEAQTEYMDNVSADSDNSSNDTSASSSVPASSVYESVDSGTATANAVKSTPLTEINRGKNANRTNVRKNVSYAANPMGEDGRVDGRGGSGDIDRFFMDGDVDNAAENREFAPHDEVSDSLAAYVPKKTDEGLLPVEEKDWFEDVTPTRIKNRHLINIYRPVGVNTISTSLKNPSLDIRGNPANPKTVVSPFLNSSIEPDHNIRGLCVD